MSRRRKREPRTFQREVYRVAAMERITVAHELYRNRPYVLTHYVAGLAAECLFRAYRCRIGPAFNARHDLNKLYKASRFGEVIPSGGIKQYVAASAKVATRWDNAHRYRSEDALRAYLRKAKLNRGVQGDFAKESSRRILKAAAELVNLGDKRWHD